MYLYKIINSVSDSVYIGITRNSLHKRFSSHKNCAKKGIKTPLYDSMRSKGVDKFTIELIQQFNTTKELEDAEYLMVKQLRSTRIKVYNILDGGASYFPIKDKEARRLQMIKARKGRKPALGMKHSEDNKKLFSNISKAYWSTQQTYKIEDIIGLKFKEANSKFGISRTHFYRLLKQTDKE